MKTFKKYLYVLLFITDINLSYIFGKDLNDIRAPYIVQLPNGGIKLTVSDVDHICKFIQLNADLECNGRRDVIRKPFVFDEITKYWFYEDLNIPYCQNGKLNYDLFLADNTTFRQITGSAIIAGERKPSSSTRAQSKQNGLLPGLTGGLLGGVNLDLLGLHVTNENNENSRRTSSDDFSSLSSIPSTTEKVVTADQRNSFQNCEFSKTTINNNQKVCKGELIFEDDFNEMNWTKWERDIRIPLDSNDAEFVSFQNFKENLYIKDGVLYILPKLLTDFPEYNEDTIRNGVLDLGINCTAIIDRELECRRQASYYRIIPPVVSAHIKTKNKFIFQYGIIEIRAKLPKGDWLFPQLFLEPATNYYGITGFSSGQIRLAFIRGNEILDSAQGEQIDGFRLYGGVVLTQGEKFREAWMKNILTRRHHFGDDYHTFKTIWTDNFISFSVDNNEYGSLYGNFSYEAFVLNQIDHAEFWKNGNKMAPFDKEFYLSLGVSVGGISDFPDNSQSGTRSYDKKPWKNYESKNELNFWKSKAKWYPTWVGENAALKVDYVRIWAL